MDRLDYSLDFLQSDWSGSGLGFEIACIFGSKEISSASLAQFLERLNGDCWIDLVRVIWSVSQEEWREYKHIDVGEGISDLINFQPKVPDEIYARIRDQEDSSWTYYCYLLPPDELEIGSQSEFFYSGCFREDRQRATSLVRLVSMATGVFGPCLADFGVEGSIMEQVRNLAKGDNPPNFFEKSDSEVWVSKILRDTDSDRVT